MRNTYSSKLRRYGSSPKRAFHPQPRLDAHAVKAGVHPAEFYQREFPGWIPKRDHGWVMGPLCPEHADRRPGSFVINLTTGAALCYSCGFKAGDIIDFTMQRHGLNFLDALHRLAAEWGCA